MLDLKLNDQVALVTGAGQGVGRRIAIDLATQGCRVGVNDLFPERAEAVAAEIRAVGNQAVALPADICDAGLVSAMFCRLREAFGPVGILVNNAGIPPALREPGAERSRFADTTLDEQHAMVALNVHGTLYCCREALLDMREVRRGRIISIVSEAGRMGEARLAVYSGAKAAIVGITKALAREYSPLGITVNTVALGAVMHEGIKAGPLNPLGGAESEAMRARMMKSYPAAQGLGRLGIPEDVSAAVLYLSSPLAAFVTGQSLGVSGGFYMQ